MAHEFDRPRFLCPVEAPEMQRGHGNHSEGGHPQGAGTIQLLSGERDEQWDDRDETYC
jgi:hypothetical protein